MGYDRIIDWVEDHFKPSDYSSYFAYEQAIKQRFNADGIDLPKGAESQMMDHFEKFFEKTESPITVQPTISSFVAPEPEIFQISTDFFAVGAPVQEKQKPLPDLFRDVSTPKMSFFGKVKGFFGRLFR